MSRWLLLVTREMALLERNIRFVGYYDVMKGYQKNKMDRFMAVSRTASCHSMSIRYVNRDKEKGI